MQSKADVKTPNTAPEKPPKTDWFATFTILDASGAISSRQLERLIAPMKKLFQRAFGLKAV